MLPWNYFQGSVVESMGALLGNQNLIQKTYFPRELIPAATVASKFVSHLIEMSLLVTVIVLFGNWRALPLPACSDSHLGHRVHVHPRHGPAVFPGQRVLPGHPALLQHLVLHMDVPDAHGLPLLRGRRGPDVRGASGSATILNPRTVTVLGHVFSLGTLFKLNPMTDAVLVFQSFIYDGTYPGSTTYMKVPVSHARCGSRGQRQK
jgi:hypothetical protein